MLFRSKVKHVLLAAFVDKTNMTSLRKLKNLACVKIFKLSELARLFSLLHFVTDVSRLVHADLTFLASPHAGVHLL